MVNKALALSLGDFCNISVGMDCSEVERLVDVPGLEKPLFAISSIMAPSESTCCYYAARTRLLSYVLDSAEQLHPLKENCRCP
ncbi:hypothetical protein C1H84_14940 [Glutamicibacter soli]|uniref:Uncharacterized protein n=1 Tax=Glutamicibacter soli TaxID=453836 RepID=A0A365YAV3_9MICC|nr:hypothetical protein [Glutamicibacter soli]RBL99698.1 hypothetical protein C1H84_14940 [Glutamicibacter soli]